MIRPSTTKKITAAITKTVTYRSRISWPSTLFASGGKKLFQIGAALRATRTASAISTAAAISHPMIAVVDGLLPGVDDIDSPRTRWRREICAVGAARWRFGAGRKAASDAGRIGAHHNGADSWGAPQPRRPVVRR
jgi:hypothetical protein